MITQHAKDRLQERQNIHIKPDRNRVFNDAMQYGRTPAQYTGTFQKWLISRLKGKSKIKVYNSYVWIYVTTQSGPKLITTYKVPEEFNEFLDKNYKFERGKKINILNQKKNLLENEYKEFLKLTKGVPLGDIMLASKKMMLEDIDAIQREIDKL